ncbi:MAG: protein TolR [Nitrospinota bacterium]|jgi:biopolymer transport protein TolR|nr:protein TolR [Nitrospinota bacterium]HJM43957.1 protein TolR [Nitrospinota bacterium]
MGANSKKGRALAEINVTPLVDVMLVLLIIFMVTAPMLQQGVDVDLPAVAARELPLESGQLIVSITKDRRVFLNRAPLTVPQLREKLMAIYREKPNKEIFLRADRDVPYGFVVGTMAAIRASGIHRVGMVTEAATVKRP